MDDHGGDRRRHHDPAALDGWTPPAAPRDRGRVELLVARSPGEGRHTPTSVVLTVDGPVPGDRWSPEKDPERGSQITAMEAGVGRFIANGQDLALFGDNLVVDLALDEANLPVGSRVRAGTAVLEVTAKPHTGCKKYAARFGVPALAWISTPERRALRLRGLHLRVVAAGEVRVGDPIEVLSRITS